jgi:hypothetical protein
VYEYGKVMNTALVYEYGKVMNTALVYEYGKVMNTALMYEYSKVMNTALVYEYGKVMNTWVLVYSVWTACRRNLYYCRGMAEWSSLSVPFPECSQNVHCMLLNVP